MCKVLCVSEGADVYMCMRLMYESQTDRLQAFSALCSQVWLPHGKSCSRVCVTACRTAAVETVRGWAGWGLRYNHDPPKCINRV